MPIVHYHHHHENIFVVEEIVRSVRLNVSKFPKSRKCSSAITDATISLVNTLYNNNENEIHILAGSRKERSCYNKNCQRREKVRREERVRYLMVGLREVHLSF